MGQWSEEYWWKRGLGQTISKRVWLEGGVVKEEEMKISSSMDGGELQDDGVCVR